MTRKLIKQTMMFLGIMLLTSCSKSFDEPIDATRETINGIDVKWRSQVTEEQKSTIRDILQDMVFVEGDYFVMGATPEQDRYARPNEYPNSYISLSNYYICKYEVSDEQFNVIMDDTKSSSSSYPSRISYEEWERFIVLLQDMTMLNFNFPTEAQWEFAARGGKSSKRYLYPGSNDINEIRSTSFTVGSKVPNELGLFNMGDLKSEWCMDLYGDLISGNLLINWVQREGKYHVVRGGNYLCTIESDKYLSPTIKSELSYQLSYGTTFSKPEMDYRNCRVTSRAYCYDSENRVGCRLVLNIP